MTLHANEKGAVFHSLAINKVKKFEAGTDDIRPLFLYEKRVRPRRRFDAIFQKDRDNWSAFLKHTVVTFKAMRMLSPHPQA